MRDWSGFDGNKTTLREAAAMVDLRLRRIGTRASGRYEVGVVDRYRFVKCFERLPHEIWDVLHHAYGCPTTPNTDYVQDWPIIAVCRAFERDRERFYALAPTENH